MSTEADNPSAPAAEPPPTSAAPELPKIPVQKGSESLTEFPDKHNESFAKRAEKSDGEKVEEEESRETKRRRTSCQLEIENVTEDKEAGSGREIEIGAANLSFSFDTKIASPIDKTPKFGSFNLLGDGLVELKNVSGEEEEEEESEKGEGKLGI